MLTDVQTIKRVGLQVCEKQQIFFPELDVGPIEKILLVLQFI